MRQYRRNTNAPTTPLQETLPGLTAGHGESVVPPLPHTVSTRDSNELQRSPTSPMARTRRLSFGERLKNASGFEP